MSSRCCQFCCVACTAGLLLAGGFFLARRMPSNPDSSGATVSATGSKQSGIEAVRLWQSPLVVEVTGREFEWYFRYPGADGKFETSDDTRVEKDLHVPLDVDIVLQLKSDDYVYTFSIPDLELKEIAVPQLTFTLPFRASAPGTFELLADPLCNFRFYHDELMGRLIIQEQSEFSIWLASRQ